MYFNVRISSKIFYCIVLACIAFTVYVFVFSPKGFLTLDSKKTVIENKKKRLEELNRKKVQITSNIERLKTDKEYILSYAKTFGYLDSSKNEKIIKIIKDEKEENSGTAASVSSKKEYENESHVNIKGALILAFMIVLCFVFYLILLNKNILPKFKKKRVAFYKG
ncbi:septum formation initiator family protein [uncultured Brachyspira sp.]|uniref:FtsB family cell division protein n=1 Tax=uncultured Brachyspira sp. TaxID=221953 RepID=UPI00260BA7C8|nr:septum formation initiator family protein [uncultured Brachyspira sp.]